MVKDPFLDKIMGKESDEQTEFEINLSEDDLARVKSDHAFASTWCSENYESEEDQEKCVVAMEVAIYESEEGEEEEEFRGNWWELISFKVAIFILVFLTLAVDYNMIVSSLTDPGILPARIWPTWVNEKYTADPIYDEKSYSRAPINTVSYLQVNQHRQGHVFRLKFC